MSGQSVVDRLNAAKHSLAGSGLAKTVCKATTEEVTGPKRKHLDCKYGFAVMYLFYTYRISSLITTYYLHVLIKFCRYNS